MAKLLPDVPLTGIQLKFRAEDAAKLEGFDKAVCTYHELVPTITAAKSIGIAEVTNDTFFSRPINLPTSSNGGLETMLAPLVILLTPGQLVLRM